MLSYFSTFYIYNIFRVIIPIFPPGWLRRRSRLPVMPPGALYTMKLMCDSCFQVS